MNAPTGGEETTMSLTVPELLTAKEVAQAVERLAADAGFG